jgi:hypothetical protein
MPQPKIGSTSSGNRSRPPKYQNAQGRPFVHNPNSKKTKQILASKVVGVCVKCKDKIEWRKKYRKYKPLTQPKSCNDCNQRKIVAAYHVICVPCATQRGGVCEMCLGDGSHLAPTKPKGIIKDVDAATAQDEDEELRGLKERERRAILRRRQREENPKGSAGYESYSDDEEGESDGEESCDEDEGEGEQHQEEGGEQQGGVEDEQSEIDVNELNLSEKPAAAPFVSKPPASSASDITESIFKMAASPVAPIPVTPLKEEAAGETEGEAHFGAGNDMFGCSSSRNYAKFKM